MNRPNQLSRRAFVAGGGAATLSGCAGEYIDRADYPKTTQTARLHVDIHCHTFNGSDLPIEGFLSRTRFVPRSIGGALHREINRLAPSGAEELERLQDETKLPAALPPLSPAAKALLQQAAPLLVSQLGPTLGTAPSLLQATIETTVKPRYLVTKELVDTYPTVQLFTPLLVDYDYFDRGRAETPLADQLRVQSRITELSVRGHFGRARVHSFAPFNPMKEAVEVINSSTDQLPYRPLGNWKPGEPYACDARLPELSNEPVPGSLSYVRHAIERLGFAGVKVYPPSGFLPLGNATSGLAAMANGRGRQIDQALEALYAYCEAEQVPITTHTGDSNAYDLGYGRLAEPARWEAVLARFPNLRLNLGHFGFLDGIDENQDAEHAVKACGSWMQQAAQLMRRYPHVYADVGDWSVTGERQQNEFAFELLRELTKTNAKVSERLMYGSDWWMDKLLPNSDLFLDIFAKEYAARDELATYIDRFMGKNAMEFLGFTDPYHRNRLRLRAFYARTLQSDHPETLPAWLT